MRVAGHRQLHHPKAVGGRGHRLFGPQPGLPCRHEDHPLQLQLDPDFLRNKKVTQVNRIEGAAKDPYPHSRTTLLRFAQS